MDRSVTNLDFMRGASFIAKRAGDWSGSTACSVMGGLDGANDPVREDTLRRFRKDILEMLDGITPTEDGPLCCLSRLRQAIVDNTKGDLFWIGEILLAELEKETGFRGDARQHS